MFCIILETIIILLYSTEPLSSSVDPQLLAKCEIDPQLLAECEIDPQLLADCEEAERNQGEYKLRDYFSISHKHT